MINVSVLGATGYAGIELVRLLTAHPRVNIQNLISHSYANKKLKEIYPQFSLYKDIDLKEMDIEKIAATSDLVFLSLPHGASSKVLPSLYKKGVKIIDLSGDFRYKSKEVFEKWYGYNHPSPELLKEAVYGMPELHKEDIKKAKLVGNPGCYPTGAILGIAPLVKEGQIEKDSIIVDAKSGTTGAGRSESLALSFSEVNENIKAYKVSNHRHTSEIEEELKNLKNDNITLSFTPHLLPVKRGILTTIYAELKEDENTKNPLNFDKVFSLYEKLYNDAPFVNIYPEGKLPEIKYVNGSNAIHIGFVVDKRTGRIIIITAIDNLIKGAGGQAIQNMNLMFGLDEREGLNKIGWYL